MEKKDIEYCNGEPTIGNACPHRMICKPYLDFEVSQGLVFNRTMKFLSAYKCSQEDWNNFIQTESFSKEPLIVLTNGMIIRKAGRHPNKDLTTYRVVIPKDTKPLVFDGNTFFITNNITSLEPVEELKDVKIFQKEDKA